MLYQIMEQGEFKTLYKLVEVMKSEFFFFSKKKRKQSSNFTLELPMFI